MYLIRNAAIWAVLLVALYVESTSGSGGGGGVATGGGVAGGVSSGE